MTTMVKALLYASCILLLALAAIGAVLAIPLIPAFAAMQWGCSL
ncbi:hypothetical protein OSS47_00630 [Pseudomonas citronellolis]|nr:hypothetical protein [Pseudomonas citronellolis]WAB92520.1 hypothetical protein OSS47_00630 [Pseudomonas citronellolis]